MAKNVRISDELYALAQLEARLQDRSIAQQLEHWAKRGIAGMGGTMEAAAGVAAAVTRRLDTLDVTGGQRRPDYLHFVPRDLARASQPVFPPTYRKS
jgi:exopolyphosphatase/pppGpp-phosphohydrolase